MAKFKTSAPDQGQLVPMYLGEWIPANHLIYLVSDIVDQLDLSAMTSRYSNRGEEAYHPALLLKILFYGYATGIFTSRKLREALDEHIPLRWLSGGLRPDYRTISDFRKNNLSLLPGFFAQIVQVARDLGYASLGHVSVDGSKIKANASKHKAMSRDRMKDEILRLEQEIAQRLAAIQSEDEQEDSLFRETSQIAQEYWIEDRKKRLSKIKDALAQLELRSPQAASKEPGKEQINFTDSDSRIMDTKTQGVIQAYNPQIAVDADYGLIVGIQMSHCTNDQQQFAGVLQSIQQTTGQVPEKVTADAGYFSTANIQVAQDQQVDAYIAATREAKQSQHLFDKANFTYQPESDTYLCPAGKIVSLKYNYKYKDNANETDKPTSWVYECQECLGCPFQKECTKAKNGKRTVTRKEADPLLETMRTKVRSDEGKAIYRRRKGIVEPAWGQIKQCQGFRQFHLRGDNKTEGEFTLVSIAYNIRKLHSAKYPKPSTLYKREKSAQKRKAAGE